MRNCNADPCMNLWERLPVRPTSCQPEARAAGVGGRHGGREGGRTNLEVIKPGRSYQDYGSPCGGWRPLHSGLRISPPASSIIEHEYIRRSPSPSSSFPSSSFFLLLPLPLFRFTAIHQPFILRVLSVPSKCVLSEQQIRDLGSAVFYLPPPPPYLPVTLPLTSEMWTKRAIHFALYYSTVVNNLPKSYRHRWFSILYELR